MATLESAKFTTFLIHDFFFEKFMIFAPLQ